MVKNCRNIRGIEGISLLLILMWTLGDTSNLVGAILTGQLPLQVYIPYSKILPLRSPLVLPINILISGMVLILNIEKNKKGSNWDW